MDTAVRHTDGILFLVHHRMSGHVPVVPPMVCHAPARSTVRNRSPRRITRTGSSSTADPHLTRGLEARRP